MRSIEVAGSDTDAPRILAKRLGIMLRWRDLAGLRVLDAGCGAGGYVTAMAAAGADAAGIEYMADKVAEWQARHPGDDRVRQGTLAAIDFPDASFDAVLLNEVLEHVPDDRQALQEIFRVLKPGGTLFMFTPSRWYPVETHGFLTKSGKHLSGLRAPFLPWIPLRISERYVTFWARNYWPGELATITRGEGFAIDHHGFVWQTFENISGGRKRLIHRIAPLARAVADLAERLPIVHRFGVSQLIVARRPGTLPA